MKENRIGIIKDLIEKNGRMSLEQLGERFPNVSSMTLRRDLLSLEESGVLVRVRGGAVSVQELSKKTEDQYSRRAAIQVAEKKQIAEKAVKLVEPGTSLFIDSGSTALYFAKELPDLSAYSKESIARALMEGIAGKLKERISGTVKIDRIAMCGGPSSSKMWRQVISEVFGAEVTVTYGAHSGAVGAAMYALK